MKTMKKTWGTGFGIALLACSLAGPFIYTRAVAQGTAAPPATPPAASEDRRGPLPFYFGKLGLSDPQKESLYTLQSDYEKKLEPLREQLKLLVRERDQKMELLLTAGQKLRLKELRDEAALRTEKPDANTPPKP